MPFQPSSETSPVLPAIRCRGLAHGFAGRPVLAGIDFEVAPGSLSALLGPNGSGKSTVIKLLAGLLTPLGGTIHIAGLEVAQGGAPLKQRIGVVPERLALLEHLTVEEHFNILAPVYGLTRTEVLVRRDGLIDALALEEVRYLPIRHGSYGTRKKLALALALLHAPQVLLLDEPFEGLDPVAAHVVRQLFLRLAVSGATVFFTSHALSLVERVATQVLLLQGGRIHWEGSPGEVAGSLESFYFEQIELPEPPELPWLASPR
ncbi:MAG: ABC transporter ATP-binding protein [Holophagaceae bacterium]|jgi:ABC-2 type transport system ATP-binding protein|nr:ABC transporter ATP-binding protein [Holophagaceae bacterium]